MIHLFRKIRHKLLQENRFKKYLLYALGEIFLVMVGILLALHISNINQEKENEKKEVWYLNNIAEDLVYQESILTDMVLYYEECIIIENTIINDFYKDYSFNKIDSLNYKLDYLMTTSSFPKADNTYNQLVTTGDFKLIRRDNLRINIINYSLLDASNFKSFDNDLNNIFYKTIYPVINTYYQVLLYEDDENELDINSELSLFIKNELEKPKAKLALINAVKTKLILQENFLELVKESLFFNDSLLKEIDDYLYQLSPQ